VVQAAVLEAAPAQRFGLARGLIQHHTLSGLNLRKLAGR